MKNKKTKIITGSIFLIITILLWVLPIVAESLIEKNSKEWVGRNISINDIDINLFTGTLKLFQFDLYEEDGAQSFVSFDTLVLNTRPYDFFASKVTLQQLYVKNLNTHIIKQNDSTFNFDSLIDFFASPLDTIQEADTSIDSTEVLMFSLSNIEFVNSELHFNDEVIKEVFVLNELDFLIPNIEWNQKDKSNADLEFNLKHGGSFSSSTSFDPVNGDFSANIGLMDIDISPYTKYLKEFLLLDSADALISTKLNFHGNSNSFEDLSIDGFVTIEKFNLTDTLKNPILSAEKIHCVFDELEPLKNSYKIDSVSLLAPFVAFELNHTTTNFESFFKLNEPIDSTMVVEVQQEEVQSDSVQPLYYKLKYFGMKSGKFEFIDATTTKPFEYHLSNIEVNLDSLDSHSEKVAAQAEMLLNNRGEMKVDISFNPSDPMELALKYVISGFELSDMNIYSMDYMGVPVLEGDMFYKTNTTIHNGDLNSQNTLIVHDATLGDKRGGLYNLPLKFALFLLKDKDGVISLDIPVGGNLDDPSVSINKIVLNTLKNLLVKTVASPVKFLSGMVGGDPKDLESVQFSYLDTVVSEAHIKQLEKLEDLEKKKKGLLIEMLYLNDTEMEKNHISVQQVGQEFNETQNKDYLVDEEDFKVYLLKKTQPDISESMVKKMMDSAFVESACFSLANAFKIDSLAVVYESKRIEGIRKQLLLGKTENHIKVKKAQKDDTDNIASKPVFKIVYSIEE